MSVSEFVNHCLEDDSVEDHEANGMAFCKVSFLFSFI
ncbi:hypothetical protein SLEP1_g29280 [Rubroshorea leprosula]|uniref:Uncharacterized protein n=1 Tax=Rubroshorea leprosula TaxID=152421 RepID=A0AAV5K774_9ROSI|nr:hypothetical protein SLEP1_g29280 [Rubroshorea leprosula]